MSVCNLCDMKRNHDNLWDKIQTVLNRNIMVFIITILQHDETTAGLAMNGFHFCHLACMHASYIYMLLIL